MGEKSMASRQVERIFSCVDEGIVEHDVDGSVSDEEEQSARLD